MAQSKNSSAEFVSFAPNVSLDMLDRIPHPRPDSWGPPPYHPYLVMDQQERTKQHVHDQAIQSVPEGTPESVKKMFVDTTDNRFVARMVANYDNFANAQKLDAELSPAQRHIGDWALAGLANPAETTYFSELIAMRGAAIGTVSGENEEAVEEMDEALEMTLELFGGKRGRRSPQFRIKGFDAGLDSDVPTPTVLLTRKVTLGRVAHTIWFMKRTSYLLRLDSESETPPAVREELLARTSLPDFGPAIVPSEDAHRDLASLTRRANPFSILKLATSVYKYNEGIPKPANPFPNEGHDPRKRYPNIAFELTRVQLRQAGIPTNLSEARHVPLPDLVVPPAVQNEYDDEDDF